MLLLKHSHFSKTYNLSKLCPACKNYTNRFVFRNNFKLALCDRCNLLFWNGEGEIIVEGQNKIVVGRPFLGEINTLRWGQIFFLKTQKATSKYLLDFGCGNGNFLASCTKHGINVVGCETADNLIAFCTEHKHRVVKGTSDLQDATFDYVTMWEVLEHLENPIEVFDDLRRILKPGGVLVLSTPNRLHPAVSHTKLERYWPPHHITFWEKKSLIWFLQEQGFQIVDIHYRPFQYEIIKHKNFKVGLHEVFLMGMEIVIIAKKN